MTSHRGMCVPGRLQREERSFEENQSTDILCPTHIHLLGLWLVLCRASSQALAKAWLSPWVL